MPSALAIAAHPDDIEFVMAGTLLQLKAAGWDIHYLNVSTGNMGSTVMSADQTARVRRKEGQTAAKLLGAKWYAPLCDDMLVFYNEKNIRRLTAVVRAVRPSVVLTHALADYMEDHMTVARLTVTAAFSRGIPNFRSIPQRAADFTPCVIYHAMPHGLRTPLREVVTPEIVVDTTSVHSTKLASLACHSSQQEWLDVSQGQNSYLQTMEDFSRQLGRQSKKFRHAEGWTRHLHYGFGAENDDPLRDVLGKKYLRTRTRP
jgi:LmbE family N-acetylglucosaminyl deacetylase